MLVPGRAPRLDRHRRPRHPARKGEPYHLHHDLLFAFHALSREVQLSDEAAPSPGVPGGVRSATPLPRNIRARSLTVSSAAVTAGRCDILHTIMQSLSRRQFALTRGRALSSCAASPRRSARASRSIPSASSATSTR